MNKKFIVKAMIEAGCSFDQVKSVTGLRLTVYRHSDCTLTVKVVATAPYNGNVCFAETVPIKLLGNDWLAATQTSVCRYF